MLVNGPSADQVRNAAGYSFGEAQVACYMAAFAASKHTLSDFMDKGRMDRRGARDFAFRFGIVFDDYDPFAKPRRLEWRKAKPGWELLDGDAVIGTCLRQSDGRYKVEALDFTDTGWNRSVLMQRAAEALDASDHFGGKPLLVVLSNDAGLIEDRIFPVDEDKLTRCRGALHFRTTQKLGDC